MQLRKPAAIRHASGAIPSAPCRTMEPHDSERQPPTPSLGAGGRRFKSGRPDSTHSPNTLLFDSFWRRGTEAPSISSARRNSTGACARPRRPGARRPARRASNWHHRMTLDVHTQLEECVSARADRERSRARTGDVGSCDRSRDGPHATRGPPCGGSASGQGRDVAWFLGRDLGRLVALGHLSVASDRW